MECAQRHRASLKLARVHSLPPATLGCVGPLMGGTEFLLSRNGRPNVRLLELLNNKAKGHCLDSVLLHCATIANKAKGHYS